MNWRGLLYRIIHRYEHPPIVGWALYIHHVLYLQHNVGDVLDLKLLSTITGENELRTLTAVHILVKMGVMEFFCSTSDLRFRYILATPVLNLHPDK